jgi:hypothetical protein
MQKKFIRVNWVNNALKKRPRPFKMDCFKFGRVGLQVQNRINFNS